MKEQWEKNDHSEVLCLVLANESADECPYCKKFSKFEHVTLSKKIKYIPQLNYINDIQKINKEFEIQNNIINDFQKENEKISQTNNYNDFNNINSTIEIKNNPNSDNFIFEISEQITIPINEIKISSQDNHFMHIDDVIKKIDEDSFSCEEIQSC